MEASRIFSVALIAVSETGEEFDIRMDLFHVPDAPSDYPEGYKFSWIAFNTENSSERILVDCHKGKGPHFHIDNDTEGAPFEWKGLEQAMILFQDLVEKRFNVKLDLSEMYEDENS